MVKFIEYFSYDDNEELQTHKLPIYVSHKDILEYERKTNTTIDRLTIENVTGSTNEKKENDWHFFSIIFHEAVKRGHKLLRRKFELKEEDTSEILEICFVDFQTMFWSFIAPDDQKKRLKKK